MRCPKCGRIGFDYLERCGKCGADLKVVHDELGVFPKPDLEHSWLVRPDDEAERSSGGGSGGKALNLSQIDVSDLVPGENKDLDIDEESLASVANDEKFQEALSRIAKEK